MTKEENQILHSIKNEEKREKKLEILLKLYENNKEDYDVLYNIIKILGTYKEYRQRSKKLLELMINNYDPLLINYELGKIETYDRNYEKAVEKFKEVLTLEPKNVMAKLEIAKSYTKLGDNISAKEHLLELAETKQDRAAYYELGLMAEREKDQKKAKMYYKKVLLLRPYDIRSLVRIGLIEYKEGNIETAKEYFKRGYKANPNDVYILTELSRCEKDLGNPETAKKYIDKAVELNGGGVSLYEKAKVCEELGEYKEAYNTYRQLQTLEDNTPVAYRLGILLKQSGNYKEAREELLKCIKSQLKDKVLMILADMSLKEKNIEQAEKYANMVEINNLVGQEYKNITRILAYIKYKKGTEENQNYYYIDQIKNYNKDRTIQIAKQFFNEAEDLEKLYIKAQEGIKEENHFDTISAEDLYIVELENETLDNNNVKHNRLMVLTPVNEKNIISFMPTYKKTIRLNQEKTKQKERKL